MKIFIRFIGKLPFAGKLIIRQLAHNLYVSRDAEECLASYWRLVRLLVFFVLAHFIQFRYGIEAMYSDLPLWTKLIGGLYALANGLAITAQTHLVIRATRYLLKGSLAHHRRRYIHHTAAESLTALMVTIGGQAAFFACCHPYR